MQKIVSFPFTYIGITKLGKIYRPYAVVESFSRVTNYWESIEMIIDSGADYILLPKKYISILGVDLQKDCTVETTLGVGGSETVYQCKNIKFKIGDHEFNAPASFLERDDVPALLGRLNCLKDFKLTFENKVSIFEV